MAFDPNNADSIKQTYGGYAGWNDPNAILADFKSTGGAGKGGPSSTSSSSFGNYNIPDPVDTAKRLNEFQVQQNQPAIQSLESSKQPLQQRYSDLVANIKGNQQTAENRQTISTKNELARRGISGGGFYDQQLTDSLTPITNDYTNMLSQANTGQSQDLSNIGLQIAQLQAGNPSNSISSALNLTGLQSQAQSQAAQMAQQQSQFEQQQSFAQQQLKAQQEQFKALGRYGAYNPFTGQTIAGVGSGGGASSGAWS